ncbi:hypothetical protein AYI69_g2814 [Smittium culicis]|uniref:Uncharacterized protein n=1 Tax=Smittium culicis TaxID=133412 RepID=A0A1R1Y5P1_9FUNG|nr:hypothetical protein AYI69_g9673 [Smittium culicis]OMJ22094.1 hypothetical protein AYI69_g5533 [Smittium culicis]OMJ27739.1 hypothetical protein AYI69_g2814 [Smittium culicis]
MRAYAAAQTVVQVGRLPEGVFVLDVSRFGQVVGGVRRHEDGLVAFGQAAEYVPVRLVDFFEHVEYGALVADIERCEADHIELLDELA